MINISVIIPSYNQVETIRSCVGSLLAQSYTGGFEIIVVDSSPSNVQKEIEQVCAADDRIRMIKREVQTYPGTARNIGIAEAKGEIIALIDSDCLADEAWLANIAKHLKDNEVLSGVIQNGTPHSVFGTCCYLIEFNHFFAFREASRQVQAAATCNFACKKAIFEQYGYFPDYRAFEDFLFCMRLAQHDIPVFLKNDIRITHVNKTALDKVAANQKMLGKYSALVRKAHGLPPKIIFKYPMLAFGMVAYRYASILSRVYNRRLLFPFLLYTPFILYILFHWSAGFYAGAKKTGKL